MENEGIITQLLENPDLIFELCNKNNAFGIFVFLEANESQLLELFKNIDEGYYANLIFIAGLLKTKENKSPRHMKIWFDLWKNKNIGSYLFTAIEVFAVAQNRTVKDLMREIADELSSLSGLEKQGFAHHLPDEYKDLDALAKDYTKPEQPKQKAESKMDNEQFYSQIKQMLNFIGIDLDPDFVASKIKQNLEAITGKKYTDEELLNLEWMKDLPANIYQQFQNPDFMKDIVKKIKNQMEKDRQKRSENNSDKESKEEENQNFSNNNSSSENNDK